MANASSQKWSFELVDKKQWIKNKNNYMSIKKRRTCRVQQIHIHLPVFKIEFVPVCLLDRICTSSTQICLSERKQFIYFLVVYKQTNKPINALYLF